MQSVPCVAVSVGGVGEVVRSGETGILLEKHDAEAFASAMNELLTDHNKRDLLGRQARAFAVEHYSLQGCLRNFEKLYEEVLGLSAANQPI
jgi:glycosyltransferase involved in cell wall biosynthesis